MAPVTARRGGTTALLVGFLVVGVVAGVVWAWLADPVSYTVVRSGDQVGLVADEEASTAAFGVEVTYAAVGAVAAALWALVATGLWGRGGGRRLVVLTALGALVGGLVAWAVGVVAGLPTPSAGSLPAGAHVSARLALDAWGFVLVWPVVALLVASAVWTLTLPREDPVDSP